LSAENEEQQKRYKVFLKEGIMGPFKSKVQMTIFLHSQEFQNAQFIDRKHQSIKL
jgi:hypothetical protein